MIFSRTPAELGIDHADHRHVPVLMLDLLFVCSEIPYHAHSLADALFYSLAAAGSEDISNECNNNVWCRPNRQAMYCSINYACPSILSSRTTVRGDIYCQMRPYYTAEGDRRPRPPRSRIDTVPVSIPSARAFQE